MQTNPFKGKPIRAVYDKTAGKWWFSATDICMALTGRDYENARKYWNRLKYDLRMRGSQPVGVSDRLRLKAPDGKLHLTEVLDVTRVLYLIQIVPGDAAEPFKVWLAETAAGGADMADALAEVGGWNAEWTLAGIGDLDGKVYERVSVRVREFEVLG